MNGHLLNAAVQQAAQPRPVLQQVVPINTDQLIALMASNHPAAHADVETALMWAVELFAKAHIMTVGGFVKNKIQQYVKELDNGDNQHTRDDPAVDSHN